MLAPCAVKEVEGVEELPLKPIENLMLVTMLNRRNQLQVRDAAPNLTVCDLKAAKPIKKVWLQVRSIDALKSTVNLLKMMNGLLYKNSTLCFITRNKSKQLREKQKDVD